MVIDPKDAQDIGEKVKGSMIESGLDEVFADSLMGSITSTIFLMHEKERISLKNGDFYYSGLKAQIRRKCSFKYEVMISSQLSIKPDTEEWDAATVKKALDWLNDSVEGLWFLVLFEPFDQHGLRKTLRYDMCRVCFIDQEDAAAFKLYFT